MSHSLLNTIKEKPVLIESQSWGSIAYFSILKNAKQVFIDGHEHFVKASYRNRYEVCGPNGKQTLSIHLENGRNRRRSSRKVKIFYEHHWQKLHWNTLCSNYRRSPYFEYYEDDLQHLYETPTESLLEFNKKTIQFIAEQLELSFNIEYTDRYIPASDENYLDLRSILKPNKAIPEDLAAITTQKYHQVFEDRNPFFPNLSILDALFNLGPRTIELMSL